MNWHNSFTYERTMSDVWMIYVSHTDESCHAYKLAIYDIWMIRVWRMNQIVAHMNESCHTRYSFSSVFDFCSNGTFTYTHMDESCRTCECDMSHMLMSHVTHVNESCHTYEWVMSHIWMSHVTHMNESCHTYEWVMSHIWMSHVTPMNESCNRCEYVTRTHRHGEAANKQSYVMHVNVSDHTYERELLCTCKEVMSHQLHTYTQTQWSSFHYNKVMLHISETM